MPGASGSSIWRPLLRQKHEAAAAPACYVLKEGIRRYFHQPPGPDALQDGPRARGRFFHRVADALAARIRCQTESMPTYLIASNEMMCRILARRLEALDLPRPIAWHAPQWLHEAADAPPHEPSSGWPQDPADVAVIDCSGLQGDPRELLNQLQARLAPRRWLVLSDRLDASLMLHAALLGASGCLSVPAPVDLVCAATALVWAGGQCFPRMALTLAGAGPAAGSLVCASSTTATG